MEPLISILIPVYGVEQYIEKCLKSLFENTIAEKCEFIIVNDCTKDNSIKIAENLIAGYKTINAGIINHEKNSGIAAARNTGLENASGKYIIYCDSDDWVEKNFLEKLFSEAEKNNADITTCSWYEERGNESSVFTQTEHCDNGEAFINFLECKIPAYTWNKLINRNFITSHGFKFTDGINNWEDETICLKLFSAARNCVFINEPLYHYRIRNNSYIRCLVTEKTKNDFLNAISEMEKFLSDSKFDEYRDLLNFKKLHVKQKIFIDGTRYMQKKYLSLWPESYPYIKQDTTLKPRIKTLLSTAKKMPFISLFLTFIYSAMKITLKKQFTWKQYFSKPEES